MYGLVALGYHITWATSRTMNFSQGHAVMVGAVVAYAVFVGLGWPFPVALGVALAAGLVRRRLGAHRRPAVLPPRLARLAPRHHRRGHHRGERGSTHLRQGRARVPLAPHEEADHGRLRGLLSPGASRAARGPPPHGPRAALLSSHRLRQAAQGGGLESRGGGAHGDQHPPRGHGLLRALRAPRGGGRRPPRAAPERGAPDGDHHRAPGLRGGRHRGAHLRPGHRGRRARLRSRGVLHRGLRLHTGARDRGLRSGHSRARAAALGAARREAVEACVREQLGWIALTAAAAAVPLLTSNTYYLYVVISVGLLTIVTAGLNVLVGFTGQTSLGHAGLYAFGAYTAALCATRAGLPEWAAIAAALVVTSVVGAAVAAAALRVSGAYLAMATIACGLIVEGVLIEWGPVTGGPGGIFNIPQPALRTPYWTVMAAAALALWFTANLRRSAWGRACLAVKSSDVAAESLGLSAYYVRIAAFTVSAAFAGVAGALFTLLNGYISPDSFTLQTSILFLLALLFGGLGRIAGPVAGSIALTILPELLTSLLDYRLILYGSLLLLSIYWLPEGIVGALSGGRKVRADPHPSPLPGGERGVRTFAPQGRGKGEGQFERGLLIAHGLTLTFGGVAALADVNLEVRRSSIHAVIGPNGAGKTSLLNVLSGFYAPRAETIELNGVSIVGLRPYPIARLGIARTV